MEQLVRIRKNFDDGTAEVFLVRESACSGDCHKCSGCGAAKQTMLFRAVNAIGAKPGELVTVRSESAPVLKAALVLYMLPILLFFLGYFAGEELCRAGTPVGCAAFLAGILTAIFYDRRVAKKAKTVYTITGYADAMTSDNRIKGDNDLD